MAAIWTEADRLRAQSELVFRRCAVDKFFFFHNFWRIRHPAGSRLFVPRPSQTEVLNIWGDGKNSISLKARQIGWSTNVAADTFWESFFHPEYQAMLLSKGEREATQLLSQFKYGYKHLPQWMRDRGPELLDDNQQRMTFSNDSQTLSLPSSNNPARGYTGKRVVVDEMAFLSNPEEAWASVEPVTDIGGQLILLSTANGFGNLFHEQWVRATLGESTFVPSFYGWWAVPERDQAWYDQKAKEMSAWQLAQEYPDDPEEAFVKSGNMAFDYEVISQMVPAEGVRGEMVDGVFHENSEGRLTVFDFPEPNQDYVIGADTSEGLEHGDYSCADVLTPEGVQVAQWHGKCEPDEYGQILHGLGNWYNGALMVVEANNMGIATLSTLRLLGYMRLWRRQSVNTTSSGFTNQMGFLTTRVTKPLIVAELGKALRGGMVIRSQRSITELLQFVRDGKGGFSGSPHDDAVMSLSIANHGRPFVYADEYKPVVEMQPGTFDWHMARAGRMAADKSRSSRRIGAGNERSVFMG